MVASLALATWFTLWTMIAKTADNVTVNLASEGKNVISVLTGKTKSILMHQVIS